MKDGFNVARVVDSKMLKKGPEGTLELDIEIGEYETIKKRFYMYGPCLKSMEEAYMNLTSLSNAVGLREVPINIQKLFDTPFIYVHPLGVYKYMPRIMRRNLQYG